MDPERDQLIGELSQSSLANLERSDTRSGSRGFFLEMVLDLVTFIICALVCLQLIAHAQLTQENSGAVTYLGQTSQSLVEVWKSGSELTDLAEQFGGSVQGQQLTLYFDRRYQPTDDPELAWYCLVFTVQEAQSRYQGGQLRLTCDQQILIDWTVGRLGGRP